MTNGPIIIEDMNDRRLRYVCLTHERFMDDPKLCAKLGGIAIPCEIIAKSDPYRMKRALDLVIRDESFKGSGCGDANCIIYKPEGQHTNGRCFCGDAEMGKKPLILQRLKRSISAASIVIRETSHGR